MVYTTVATGFRPGGGDAIYPTTGAAWGSAFQQAGYTTKWPTTYAPDRVISYELGEKARFFDRRLTVNASVYYEDWRNPQLEAYPNDWALNINGDSVSIYGADIDVLAELGAGFQLELSAGYLYEWLEGGPHWIITPIHKMPEVAPESGTLSVNYSKALGGSYTFTARLENSYTGPRYSIYFSNPYEFSGTWSISAQGSGRETSGVPRRSSTTSPTSMPSWRACSPKTNRNRALRESKPTSRSRVAWI